MSTTQRSKPVSKAAKARKSPDNQVSLSSREICKIIKQCREYGVLSLSIEGLDIKLADEEAVKKPVPRPQPAPEPTELPKAARLVDPTTDDYDPAADPMVEEEAAQLLITDPLLYEELENSEDAR